MEDRRLRRLVDGVERRLGVSPVQRHCGRPDEQQHDLRGNRRFQLRIFQQPEQHPADLRLWPSKERGRRANVDAAGQCVFRRKRHQQHPGNAGQPRHHPCRDGARGRANGLRLALRRQRADVEQSLQYARGVVRSGAGPPLLFRDALALRHRVRHRWQSRGLPLRRRRCERLDANVQHRFSRNRQFANQTGNLENQSGRRFSRNGRIPHDPRQCQRRGGNLDDAAGRDAEQCDDGLLVAGQLRCVFQCVERNPSRRRLRHAVSRHTGGFQIF